MSFKPSNWPEKLKIVNFQNIQKIVLIQLEKVGGHRYPPGSFVQWKPTNATVTRSWQLQLETTIVTANVTANVTGN
jgi:hypothetical protein